MRVLLQRLVAPVVLLIAFIGVGIALDRFGYDELPEAGANITTTPADTPVFSIRRAPELLTSPRAAERAAVAGVVVNMSSFPRGFGPRWLATKAQLGEHQAYNEALEFGLLHEAALHVLQDGVVEVSGRGDVGGVGSCRQKAAKPSDAS